jgi:hypothetical protein
MRFSPSRLPLAPLFKIELANVPSAPFHGEGEMIEFLKKHPPARFPVFIGCNTFFAVSHSQLGVDVEIDVIFANNEQQDELLALEVRSYCGL